MDMKSKISRRNLIKIGLIGLAGCSLGNIRGEEWYYEAEEGFNHFWKAHHLRGNVPKNFEYIIDVKPFKVHLCSIERIQSEGARRGYSNANSWVGFVDYGHLWAPVSEIDGKIFPNRAVLGHEFYNTIRQTDTEKKVFDIYKRLG